MYAMFLNYLFVGQNLIHSHLFLIIIERIDFHCFNACSMYTINSSGIMDSLERTSRTRNPQQGNNNATPESSPVSSPSPRKVSYRDAFDF